MVRYFAKHKYSLVGGQCTEDQWEKILSCYLSLGYTVKRIN